MLNDLPAGSYNSTSFQTANGKVTGNTLTTTANGGYFGYGVASAGVLTTTTAGNSFSGAKFGGWLSAACIPAPYAPPTPQAAVYDPSTTSGTFQTSSVAETLVFLICLSPDNAEGIDPPSPVATPSPRSEASRSVNPSTVSSPAR